MISNNVSVSSEHERATFFKANCSCMDNDCTHTIEIAYDEEFNDITLHLWARVNYDFWSESGLRWPLKILRRIRKAIKLIFLGYLDAGSTFTMVGENQIKDYIRAFEYGLKRTREKGQ